MNNLPHKTVLVAGGAGGIGSAICQTLAEAVAAVVVTYHRDAEKAGRLLETLPAGNHALVQARKTCRMFVRPSACRCRG